MEEGEGSDGERRKGQRAEEDRKGLKAEKDEGRGGGSCKWKGERG